MNTEFILGSQSPRRKDLLEQAGIVFSVKSADIDESQVTSDSPEHLVETLAGLKAREVSRLFPDAWVLGADTIVVVDGQILGKPGSTDEAAEMLNKLNNRSHQVYTGFCLHHANQCREYTESVSTTVWFKSLSQQEILWYVNTLEPMDKAGAYGIQGVGSFLVSKIHGSYTNVVGLPVCELICAMVAEKIIQI